MKKILSFIASCFLSSTILLSQNWQIYTGDTLHFIKQEPYNYGSFNSSNSFGLSLILDTVIFKAASRLSIFKKDYSDSEFLGPFSASRCVNSSSSLFGDSLWQNGDSSIFYIDSTAEILWIKDGKSWKFFADGNNELLIQLDTVMAKGDDSLRVYSFIINAPPQHFLHQFDSAQMVVSKAKGFMESFDFSVFPDSLEKIEFLHKGPITNREIFNYEIGDEYHYNVYSNTIISTFSYSVIVKIQDKISISPDSVLYKINNSWIGYNLNKRIGNGAYLFSALQFPNIDSVGLYDDTYELASLVSTSTYVFHPDELCNIFFEEEEYTEYVFGIGTFDHKFSSSGLGFPTPETYDETLVYYKKGTTTWGTPLITSSIQENLPSAIEIYPIPSDQIITIKGNKQELDYKIRDISGKMMMQGSIDIGSDKIDLGNLLPGVYLVKFQSSDATISKKIILK